MRRNLLGFLAPLMLAFPSHTKPGLLTYDDFEYAVERNKPGASKAFAANGPWNGAKT